MSIIEMRWDGPELVEHDNSNEALSFLGKK